MKYVTTDVLRIAYLEDGPSDGMPVILLHGFPYSPDAYRQVAALLANDGFRCIRPFLRGYGATAFLSKESPRSGQQGALGADLLALMDAMAIPRALLAGFDWGGRAACIVAALWPQRVIGLVSSGNGYNIQCLRSAQEPSAPEDEHRFWYQYYFHSQRGYNALRNDRMRLCRYLWQEWSPTWAFDDAVFASSAQAFENPDFAELVAHSYRHRFNLAPGDPAYDPIEALLACQPAISVPSIVLDGAEDGVDRPMSPDIDRPHFTHHYSKYLIEGAGHNIPQEVPEVYANIVKSLLQSAM